jgi:Rrf2 family protein
MKLITRDTDYAVRALVCIAGSDAKVITVDELAEKLKVPKPFLRKILQVLNKKGILKSFKGKGGGFALAKPKEEILLVDLMEIFQGPFHLNEHLLSKRECPYMNTCELKNRIDMVEERVHDELKKINLSQLVNPSTSPG